MGRVRRADRLTRGNQRLQLFRQRRLTAADRAEQVENLLFLLEPLRGMTEERHDLIYAFFHSEKFIERRIALDDLVREDPGQPRVFRRVDELGFPDREEKTFGGGF